MNYNKSYLAGALIGIGGFMFLSAENHVVGAALFSLGLLAVIVLECNLYTGKVGYISDKSEIGTLAIMCLHNFIGAAVVGVSAYILLRGNQTAAALVQKKLALPLIDVCIKSVLCGVMIYLAVELYKRSKQILLVIMPVMIFILCGFEHCVADVFYFAAAGEISVRAVVFIAICVLGNAVGSLAVSLLMKCK